MNADPLILLVPDIEVAAASQDVADFLQFCESTSSIWNLQTNVFSTHLCVVDVLLEECLHFIVVLGQFFGMHSDDVRVGISAIVTKVKRLAQGATVVRSLSSAPHRSWASFGSTASVGSQGTEIAGYPYASASSFQ